MKRHLLTAAAAAVVTLRAASAAHGAAPADVANYQIVASYAADTHTVTGRERLQWRNTTTRPAADLEFHLYLNAFANDRSTFAHETEGAWYDWLSRHPHPWGFINLTSIRAGAADLTPGIEYIHPDDANIDDHTVVRLPLPHPVPPGGSIELDIAFVSQLPKIAARSGVAGPFAFVAQWFPKIGVFEADGWNCHQYHVTTEFFADFGTYDVTLTIPSADVFGSTGTVVAERENGDGTKTVHAVADRVHDFAWTVDPRFQVVEDTAADGVRLRALMQPNHLAQANRYLSAAKAAMRAFARDLGPYPYPQLTIVDPGPGGGGAGGMEYPTLITAGTAWWMPAGVRIPEVLAVHEFGHQYWYGMVANNEFEAAWLDEGINSYFEARLMDAFYGPASMIDVFGLRAGSLPLLRWRYLKSPQHDPITRPAWEFRDRGSYAAITYEKTALALETLAAVAGEDVVQHGLRAYFERWRFAHPTGADFRAALSQAAGGDLRWYFDQVFAGTGVLDYAVTQVDAEPLHGFAGRTFIGGLAADDVELHDPSERRYRNVVVVERLGDVQMPLDVQITFDDGSVTTEHWDGHDRWKRFEYLGTQRVEWAIADPQYVLKLDSDRLNNSRMRDAGTRGIARIAARWGFWFQSLIGLLTGL